MDANLFRVSRGEGPPLRVGLLLDDTTLPRWAAEILEHIQHSRFAELSLVVFNTPADAGASARATPTPKWRTLARLLLDRSRRRQLFYSLYQRWDRRNVDDDNPIASVDCSAMLAGIESLHVTPITSRFVHRFPDDALARVKGANLDVLLRFGFNILRGGILDAARCGVWSYHHGDNDEYRGGPAYFWELYERNPISGVVLQQLTEDLDAGVVLCKGRFATAHTASHARNRVAPYWGAATFVIQKLKDVHERGWEAVRAAARPSGEYRGRKRIYRAPDNWEMARWIAPKLASAAVRRLRRHHAEPHWRLAVRAASPPAFDRGSTSSLDGFRWFESPSGRFFADPFLLDDGGERWLFFEDYDYGARRGAVSCAPIDAHGTLGAPIPALTRPYHLSYPCIFRDKGELFMIPETWDNGAVELYRCRRFPDDWRLEAELFTARAVDTTVWIDGGRYWFFTTLVHPRGHGMQLWLFSADSLTGAWTPHPASPLSTDVRTSRGAGAIFVRDGRLMRPSQDCSANYGHSFTLNEVLALTDERYEERPAITVGPVPGLLGTHTYAHLQGLEVIDGCAPRKV